MTPVVRWAGEEHCDPGIDWITTSLLDPDVKPDACPVPLQFAIFLSLIVLVEVAVAIAGYVFRDKVSGGQGSPGSGHPGTLGPEFSLQHAVLLVGGVRVQ